MRGFKSATRYHEALSSGPDIKDCYGIQVQNASRSQSTR